MKKLLFLIGSIVWAQGNVPVIGYTVGAATATTPTFSPTAGAVANPTTVTISSGSCGAYIYWGTSNPPTTGDTHSTSITVTGAATYYAKVIGCPTFADSAVGSAAYTISGGGTAPTYSSHECHASSASCTVTGVAAGELLLLAFSTNQALTNTDLDSVTDSNGSPAFVGYANNSTDTTVFVYKVENAAAGSHTITFTRAGGLSSPFLYVHGYTGAPTSSTIDGSCAVGSGAGTLTTDGVTTGTLTTSASNETLVGFAMGYNGGLTWTAGTSPITFTLEAQTHPYMLSEDGTAATATSYTVKASQTGSSVTWAIIGCAIKHL